MRRPGLRPRSAGLFVLPKSIRPAVNSPFRGGSGARYGVGWTQRTEAGNAAHRGANIRGQARFPLAPAQLGVWYAQLLDPQVPINVAQCVDVRGAVDAELLQAVSIEAAREYESVLVRIGEADGVPYQWVDQEAAVDIPLIDVRSYPDPVAAAKEWMRAESSTPVDLLHDRLFAGALLRVEADRYFWYLRAHHIILDGFGALTNTMRVAERYTARMLGREPEPVSPSSLATLVEGEHAYRDSSRFGTDRAHWAGRVAGLDAPTSLDGRSAQRAAANLIAGRPLPEALTERMNTLAASQDSTCGGSAAGRLRRLPRPPHRPRRRRAQPAGDRSHHRRDAPLGGHAVQYRAVAAVDRRQLG